MLHLLSGSQMCGPALVLVRVVLVVGAVSGSSFQPWSGIPVFSISELGFLPQPVSIFSSSVGTHKRVLLRKKGFCLKQFENPCTVDLQVHLVRRILRFRVMHPLL